MNHYITGKMMKELREKEGYTQLELAERLHVSDKTISKWETEKGLPDISLIEPLARALKVSVVELLNGEVIVNQNRASNMLKSKFSVCPICGNVIHAMGENLNSCCGISLPVLEAEEENETHPILIELLENELFVSIPHEMTKEHFISMMAYVTNERCEMVKLYPEQAAEARFFKRGNGVIYVCCNQDGLYQKRI